MKSALARIFRAIAAELDPEPTIVQRLHFAHTGPSAEKIAERVREQMLRQQMRRSPRG